MSHLVLSGPWERGTSTLAALLRHGFNLTVESSHNAGLPRAAADVPGLAIVVLAAECAVAEFAPPSGSLPWLAVSLTDDSKLMGEAYAAGALAVLPVQLAEEALPRAVESALAVAPEQEQARRETLQRFQRRSVIDVRTDEVIEIVEGIVAQCVAHPDGSEGLLGMFGPGQMLLGHPMDGCHLRLVAHTDVAVAIAPWLQATCDPLLAERLRGRLRQTEAWAAAQSHPHLDDRILSTLVVLGEQFGRPASEGLLIDVRLTHGLLAAAVSATRTTVTRMLQTLRMRGDLTSVGFGAAERYLLRDGSQHHLPD
jgi:hypothetical protein